MNNEMVFTHDYQGLSSYIMFVAPARSETVWKYFTESALLQQWWIPQPWRIVTISMDFREGGTWRYKILNPEGQAFFATFNYGEIKTGNALEWEESFTDEAGNRTTDFPVTKWFLVFTETSAGTKVSINLHHESEKAMELLKDMQFEEGFKSAVRQLELLLQKD